MVGIYTRVSSHTQKADSQKAEIRQWIKGQKIPAKQIQWFEDKESGRSLKRPAFQNLQNAIFNGTVKTVIVWKLDRLARNHREGINVLADWCAKKVRVVAVTQQIDLQGTIGHVVAGVLLVLLKSNCSTPKSGKPPGSKRPRKTECILGESPATEKPTQNAPRCYASKA
jgi:DNA invertase Pin-like site-specific DNA recombinase